MASKCDWKPNLEVFSGKINSNIWSSPKKRKKHKKDANTNEITWLFVTDEVQSPTAEKVEISKKSAIYEPIVYAKSKFPVGFPINHTIYIYRQEGMRRMIDKNRIPKYFPSTICDTLMGFVNSKANIPLFFSSEIERIVRAGASKTKAHEDILKKGNKLANPLLKIL